MAKRRTSPATIARLRALRQKHGLGEFKNRAKTATRRVSGSSSMAKRKKTSRRSSGGESLTTQALFMAGYGALAEPFVNRVTTNSLLKGGLGWVVAKSGNGMVRSLGKAALYAEAYKLGKSGFSGLGNILGNTSTNPVANGSEIYG